MTKRKYFAEYGINMHAVQVVLLQQEDLGRLPDFFDDAPPSFHIYFIGRRPRITLDPSHFSFSPDVVRGRLMVHKGPEQVLIDFECANRLSNPIASLRSIWPHTFVDFF